MPIEPNTNGSPAPTPTKSEGGGAQVQDHFSSIEVPDLSEGVGGEGAAPEAGAGAEGEGNQPQPRLYAGRFKAVEELERAYDSSGKEARRLLAETQSWQSKHKEAVLKLERMEDELKRRAPAFKVLSPEEAARLKSEDTAGYVEYILNKERHERDEAEAKAKFESEQMRKLEDEERINASIERQHDMMLGDVKQFPKYRELLGVASRLLDLVPSLRGQEAAPRVLYYAAYGMAALNAASKAREAEEASRQQAAGEAGALADKGGANGRGGNAAPGAGGMDDLNSRIIKAGQGFKLPSFT